MTEEQNERITEHLLRMRTPLARIELAASRLGRDVATPTGRDLTRGISEAVSELDEAIGSVLRGLHPAARSQPEAEDCRGVLGELRERLEPLLTARAIEWEPQVAEEPVPGDPEATRRAALALLRTGCSLAGHGGRVALALTSDRERRRQGVALQVKRRPDASGTPDEIARGSDVRALREFVLVHGGALEINTQTTPMRAVLWLDGQDRPCGA